jgi:PAS domain S-box-containing protein
MVPSSVPGAPAEAESDRSEPDARVGFDQLLALLDNTSAVIYMRDLDGRYMLINREYERLFDVQREHVIGLTDHDLFPAEIADAFRANDLRAINHGDPLQMEEVAPGEDGHRTYLTVKFPLFGTDGKPCAICGISTDITARKRAEQEVHTLNPQLEQRVRERTAELEATTRELDAFAYSVSHDLRAPLRSLHGFSQLLLEDYGDRLDPTGMNHLHRLQANVVRMAQLIDDLLRLSRATRAELHRTPIDLTDMAHTILKELHTTEPERHITHHLTPDLTTTGDTHLVRLALHNLLANAWKFTSRHPNPHIELGHHPHPTTPTYYIRDNGAGFDPRYADKLFEPFHRLHTTTEYDGSGIGLAIVHRVITRHGGTIWAESTPNNGATFYFTLTPEE